MRHSIRWLFLFATLQTVGLGCMWYFFFMPVQAGSAVWGTSFIALFPGNLLSALLVEKLFWSSRLSLLTMAMIEVPVLLLINTALWWIAAAGLQRLLSSISHKVA